MRCFLALVPDGNGLEQLETITRPLRQWDLPAYWQHTEDFHLTLCFLGSNDQQELHGIHYAIDELAGSLIKPQLSLSGLGAFGGKTYPKNLFVGIKDQNTAVLIITITSVGPYRCGLNPITSRT